MSQPSVISSLSQDASILTSDTFLSSGSTVNEVLVGDSECIFGETCSDSPVKFKVATITYTKSHKTSPVWQYFAHFNEAFHPDMKCHRICLICQDLGLDKAVSVGKDSSPAALVSHLKTHKAQYSDYLSAKNKVKELSSFSSGKQSTIGTYVSKAVVKERFKRKYAQWIVEESMPLTVGKSSSFKNMVKACNANADIPSYQWLVSYLQETMLSSKARMKEFLHDKYYSITLDHWTSLATDSYGAITLHLIDDFKLHSFVLSCTKHENGCSAAEMESQLLSDLNSWGLSLCNFVGCITDSASNMTSFGRKLEGWNDAPLVRHYYCADHILQLTAVLAFSGNVSLEGIDEDSSVGVIRKARDLVSHVNSSVIASDKIKHAQLQCDPNCVALKLVSDVETRWWSTHALVEHILKLKDPLMDVFSSEFCFRECQDKETKLESLKLSEEDFEQLSNILFLLTPLKDAQKTLEGEYYINFSLLPQIVYELKRQLVLCQASVESDVQGKLFELISAMIDDFDSRWGESISYSSETIRSSRSRQIGIPTYSFWAMALDPRTKKKLSKVLPIPDQTQLWKDIQVAVLEIACQRANNNKQNQNNMLTNSNAIPAQNVVVRG